MTDETEHIRRLDHIKVRYDRGDMLYGVEVVDTLLKEISILSERCLALTGDYPVIRSTTPLSDTAQAFVEAAGRPASSRCEARAKKGTGEGTCDAPLSHGYCPRWRDHLEED